MSRKYAGRRPGAWLAMVTALALAVTLLSPGGAQADHGSWTVHSYTYTDASPSTYSGFSRINAQDRYDRGWVRFLVFANSTGNSIVLVSTSCERVNEGCGLVRTPSRSWSQGGALKRVRFVGCAHDTDGNHALGGGSLVADPCASRLLPTHLHTSGAFS